MAKLTIYRGPSSLSTIIPSSPLRDWHRVTRTSAFYAGMWSYDGWDSLNYIAEEIKKPAKNFPRVIMTSIPLVTVLYVLTNVAYLTILNPVKLVTSEAVAVTFGGTYGTGFAIFCAVSVAISTFGAANGSCLTGGRLTQAAARNGHMPRLFSYLSIEQRLPVLAVLFNTTISIIMVLPDGSTFTTLVNFTGFTIWLFYAAMFLALIVLRFRSDGRGLYRAYRVPLVIPVFCLLAASFMTISPIIADPQVEYLGPRRHTAHTHERFYLI